MTDTISTSRTPIAAAATTPVYKKLSPPRGQGTQLFAHRVLNVQNLYPASTNRN